MVNQSSYHLDKVSSNEYPILLAIWEASVLATHNFVSIEDVKLFREMIIEQDIFGAVELVGVRDQQNLLIGFMGISGDKLEMIFVHPDFIKKGVGKLLMLYGKERGIRKVDVNEQNKHAVRFYESFGFKTYDRSEFDENGKNYPLLHMNLEGGADSLFQ